VFVDETLTTEVEDEEKEIMETLNGYPTLVEAELVVQEKKRSMRASGKNGTSIYEAEAFEDAVILNRRRVTVIVLAVLAVFGIVIGGVCGSGKCKAKSTTVTMSVDSSMCTKMAPVSKFDNTTDRYIQLKGLFAFVYDTTPFQEESEDNPRFRAFHWIANEDPLALEITANNIDRLQQRYTLAVFYFSTQGWCWELNSNWLLGNSECLWERVSCHDGTTMIQTIIAPGNNIDGTLPSELSSLVKMTSLDLRKYCTALRLFWYWCSMCLLPNSCYLFAGNNNLVGSIPSEFGIMSSLGNLSLGAYHIDQG